MSEGVVADFVARFDNPLYQSYILARWVSDDKECCGRLLFLENVEDFRCPLGIRAVVEGQSNLLGERADLFDPVGKGKDFVGLVHNAIGRGIVVEEPLAAPWRFGYLPVSACP